MPGASFEAAGGPANATSDPHGAARAIAIALQAALARAGATALPAPGARLHAGLAGILGEADAARMVRRLQHACPGWRITVGDDRETTLAGALAGQDGAVAGVGTGSFAGLQRAGARRFVGGWGGSWAIKLPAPGWGGG